MSCSYFSTSTSKQVSHTPKRKQYKHAAKESGPAVNENSPAAPLLQEGISKLKANDFEKAEWNFEEAINLDPNYGQAYYWLARTRYKLKDTEQALNLLDKAKSLLQNSSLWVGRIQKFRSFLLQQS